MTDIYDLVIVGAGCVGMAAAYYANKKNWKVCIIEQGKIGSETRYWSSSFSARQNRVQYNEEYLTRYVLESNKEWKNVEDHFNQADHTTHKFLHQQGALWFGDKTVSTNQGNIKAANAVISTINSAAQNKADRIESLYMDKIMEGTPSFMKAFKPYNKNPDSAQSEWDRWSSLYQPDGGSVDMQASYNRFLKDAQDHHNQIYDGATIEAYQYHSITKLHSFKIMMPLGHQVKNIQARKILITVGVYTPFFLKNIMKEPYLANNAKDEYVLQEYVASYIKINDVDKTGLNVFENLPNYYNFVKENQNNNGQYSGYGFRFHSWDNLGQKNSHFVKLGTMANKELDQTQLSKAKYGPIADLDDHRILAAKQYVRQRMNYLLPDDPNNKHFPCPIIFYSGRQTLLDYLNRNNETIVVQSGGWVGKYYPLLAKTAIMMLDDPAHIQQLRSNESDVYGNFINRTRFPITSRVRDLLSHQRSLGKSHFGTAIIGAGCSGLYAAYRLNKQKHQNPAKVGDIGDIGVFDLSERISGRLKSFYFKGTTTHMELGGMRYIPTNHVLVNQIITELGIPHIKFSMNGDPIQNWSRKAYLRNDYYRMNEWSTTQSANSNLTTAYRIEGPIVGMDSFQIISFSLYMILTAPENANLLTQVFLEKTDQQVVEEKRKLKILGANVHAESSYYRDWRNYIYNDSQNKKVYNVNLNLRQWNLLKPILLFRFRFPVKDSQLYLGQEVVDIEKTYPLYKFGFQNVIQAQFGHEAYQFVAEQNGYFSNTSNASYLDQVMAYLLDFGDVSYRTLASGFDQINYAMANKLLENSSGLSPATQGIFLNHKLVDILPGTADYGKKYVLVFHIPIVAPVVQDYYLTRINYCRKHLTKETIPLGQVRPIPGTGFGQIRFTADRIILGMPRKSVTNLINEIQLLRQPISQQYISIYNQEKVRYYETFDYIALTNAYNLGLSLSFGPGQEEELDGLLAKQQESFNGGQALSPTEQQRLDELSNIRFLKSLQPLTQEQQNFEDKKKPRFEKDSPLIPKDSLQLAETTQLMPAMKIVMNFDRSWWNPDVALNNEYQKTYKNTYLVNSVEEMRGVSVTDMPTRQTLYFSSGADNMLLASYNDMSTTDFWTTLHDNFSEVWHPVNSRVSTVLRNQYPPSMDIHPAKTVLVREILKQLSLMHQIEISEQWLKECIYQFWGRDPYGAGYHNFFSGYYIPAVMKTMRKPWANENIHIVGEAYSNETGWVQGAFQTTELLLQQELNVSQLVPNYYAGY